MTENSSPKKPTLPELVWAGATAARNRIRNVVYALIIVAHTVLLAQGPETWVLNVAVIAFVVALFVVFNALDGRLILREAAAEKSTA
jgi:hypothetical protein